DVLDRSRLYSPMMFVLFWLKYKFDVFVSRLLPLPEKLSVLRKNNNKLGYVTDLHSYVWNFRLRRLPKVDRYIANDFMAVAFNDKFDLVTSVNAIEYIDYEKLFERVSLLLEEEGVFCFMVNYWWYPVNSTVIYGDFPYASQRLTKQDLRRYFDQNYPEQAPAM